MEKPEAVNHPAHYGGDVPHEVYKCLAAWGLTSNAYLWQVVKYVARAGKKGDYLEDLKKARWYLDREIGRLTPALSSAAVIGKLMKLKMPLFDSVEIRNVRRKRCPSRTK